MIEEYQSIMKNDVWEIIPRSKKTFVVTSKWIYNMKHVADGSIKKYRARFIARGFSQKEGIATKRHLHPWQGTLPLGPYLHWQQL